MKHRKMLSIVLAICMMMTVLPMFGTTAYAASATYTVGTNTNEEIVNALTTAAISDTITLEGGGTVTLTTGDTVNCSVVISPGNAEIIIDGGNFTAQSPLLQVSCSDISGKVTLKNGSYFRTLVCTGGSLVLDNTVLCPDNATCIDISAGAVDVGLINGSRIITNGDSVKTIRVDGGANVRSIFVNEGCTVLGGYSCIDATGGSATTIQNISIGGELSNSRDSRYAIDLGPNTTIENAITVLDTGVVQAYGSNGVAINSAGKIGTLDVKGYVLGEQTGVCVTSNGTDLSEIGSLSVTGRISGRPNSIAVSHDDATLCKIGANGFDVNSGVLSGKTNIHRIGTTGIDELEMKLTSAWGAGNHFVAKAVWTNENLPVVGGKVFLYNATDRVNAAAAATTNTAGLATISFTPEQSKQYYAVSNAFYDTQHGALLSSTYLAPNFTAHHINVGDYALLGRHNGEPVLWRCVSMDENGPLMLSDKIISIKAFDAAGTHPNDHNNQRVSNGSNLWSAANIRAWLNSADSTVSFPCGNAPVSSKIYHGHNPYDSEKGFLASGNFTANERGLLKEVSQRNILGTTDAGQMVDPTNLFQYNSDLSNGLQNYFTAYAETVQDSVFLLDFRQAYDVYQNSATLGMGYLKAYPTQKAVDSSTYKVQAVSTTTPLSYWLRTPHTGTTGAEVRRVDAAGLIDTEYANHGDVYGIRPAFYLKLDNAAFTQGDGSLATPYALSANQPSNYTISYNANGGSGSMMPATVASGGTYTVLSNTFTRAGYSFVRWNTQANGGGTEHAPNAAISNISADITLYAQWSANGGNGGNGGGNSSAESSTVYHVTKGADSIYVIGAKAGLSFTCDGPYSKFSGIWVDGASQPKGNYAVQEGSTIVTLTTAYLKTLSAGKHTLRFVYTSGYAQTEFTVKNHYNPQTGVWDKADTADTKFSDIANHWAKSDIEFVAARGLFTGTGNGKFSPNTSMTRGMFVTALGRMAQADVSKYATTKFTDVKSGSYYLGYVEWAAANGIVKGTSDTTFAPDKAISRQEMATIMASYAKAIGFALPKAHAEATFADNVSIGAWAKDSVKAMQMAGVLMGKDGNKFDPQGMATRAEVSALLHRFIELAISTDTAEGWVMNDSGKWLYFENGKAVTGTKAIGGATYQFDKYGVTADAPKDRKYGVYTVQKDDSFWLIAKKFNCSMQELASINGKTLFSILYVGNILKVPQK